MIQAHDLVIGYNNKPILKVKNFYQREGEVVFVVGRNGSGKTSFLRVISGVLNPMSGEVHKSQNISQISFLPSEYRIPDGISVMELINIYEVDTSSEIWITQIEDFGIRPILKRRTNLLSSGELQRVLIALTIARGNQLVVLDEPLNYLDWYYSLVLHRMIEKLILQGYSFLISTHDLNWSIKFDHSKTLLLSENEVIDFRSTVDVLEGTKFQSAFNIKSKIMNNPLDKSHIVAMAVN